jgi:hypothetical protein
LAFIGLAGSVALWAASTFAYASAVRSRVEMLPPAWRDHPELGPEYRALLAYGARDYARDALALWPWFAGATAYVAGLGALGVRSGVLIGAAVVFSGWCASGRLSRSRAQTEMLTERDRLPPVEPSRRDRLTYRAAVYAIYLWLILAGCFAGLAVLALVR